MQFFDQQSLNGGISGTGVKRTLNRLDAVRNQLFVAGRYKNRNKTSAACTQLARTVKHIDPDNTPDVTDLVTGSGGGAIGRSGDCLADGVAMRVMPNTSMTVDKNMLIVIRNLR